MYMGIIYMISRARGYSAEALFSSEFHRPHHNVTVVFATPPRSFLGTNAEKAPRQS